MSPLNTVILFSITLTWVSLASSKVIYSDDYGDLMEMRGDIYSDSEESEERTRSKRYPVHLDPNFGSIFRIRVGGEEQFDHNFMQNFPFLMSQ